MLLRVRSQLRLLLPSHSDLTQTSLRTILSFLTQEQQKILAVIHRMQNSYAYSTQNLFLRGLRDSSQHQQQQNPPTMTSTSSSPTINLSENDEVTVVTMWDVKLHKNPSYRIATAFYFCCCRRCRHRILLLLPLLLPLPSSLILLPLPLSTAAVNCHLLPALPPPPLSAIALHCNLPPLEVRSSRRADWGLVQCIKSER